MNALQAAERAALHARVLALIRAGARGARDDGARDALLGELFAYQRRWLLPYARFCAQPGRDAGAPPALPCDAFRFARIASHAPDQDVRSFRSSGTSQGARSTHFFADLSLYDAAAEAAARYALFPDRARMQLVILAPSEQELPDSSLSYMLARFQRWFGTPDSRHVWPLAEANVALLIETLAAAEHAGRPLCLLGTSFAFVHALDALGERRFALPAGSRLMHTGGYKGRSRELAPEALRAALAACFGLPEPAIVAEYGMTELSSQLYEPSLRALLLSEPRAPRTLWAPPWLKVSVVHPERLVPLPEGEVGLVRLDDAANLDSVCALQTADLGVLSAEGLRLCGRAQGAVARGCSISADVLLGGDAP